MKTQILRDTNQSFVKTSTKENGKSFSRKLEKGSPEYGNACMTFHQNGVSIEIGNKVERSEQFLIQIKMSKIKLLKAGELEDGTQRFQSQLLVGKDTADFIMDTDGIMKCYRYGDNGFNFYPYNKPYEIVSTKSDMVRQAL